MVKELICFTVHIQKELGKKTKCVYTIFVYITISIFKLYVLTLRQGKKTRILSKLQNPVFQ